MNTGAPYGVLLAVVVVVWCMIGEQGEAILGAISELPSPTGLLPLPVILLSVIQFLSSNRGNAFVDFSMGSPDSIHFFGGSSIGIALLLLYIFLHNKRISLFGGGQKAISELLGPTWLLLLPATLLLVIQFLSSNQGNASVDSSMGSPDSIQCSEGLSPLIIRVSFSGYEITITSPNCLES